MKIKRSYTSKDDARTVNPMPLGWIGAIPIDRTKQPQQWESKQSRIPKVGVYINNLANSVGSESYKREQLGKIRA